MFEVLLKLGKNTSRFKNFEEMFQSISEEGLIVEDVKDGIIKTKDKKELEFMIVTKDNTEEKFKKEIEQYRDKLRESILPLIKQGIVTKEQAGKLKEQFDFLSREKK
jgi:radical SAM superfamily enzyme with C-terminal helix-hairpin-helix motif